MGAPKGNKYGEGNPNSGRPREYDPELIAKQLDEWVEKEDSINFVGFCSQYKYLPDLINRMSKENKAFSDAYKNAKVSLASRRERLMNQGKLNYGSFHRYQSVYDPFLHTHEEEIKDRDSERRTKAQTVINIGNPLEFLNKHQDDSKDLVNEPKP